MQLEIQFPKYKYLSGDKHDLQFVLLKSYDFSQVLQSE